MPPPFCSSSWLGARIGALGGHLPPQPGAALVTVPAYPGGHMMYMRPGSRRALTEDAQALYRRALAPRAGK
jgi:hypothetical protein